MAADNERILNGGEPATGSVNTVKDVPEDFKKWITKNSDRIAKAEKRDTLPYFIKDNQNYFNNISQSNTPKKQVKTEDEKADIQAQWDARKNANLPIQVQKLTNGGEYDRIVGGKVNPASLDSTFLGMLDNNISIDIVNKPKSGSWWSPSKKSITLDNVKRRMNSEWFNKSLVYHEGGHSIADMRNLFQTKEFNDMTIKHVNLMKGSNAKLIHEKLYRLRKRIDGMKDDVFTKRNITKDDVKEQILGASDALAALTSGKYGWGHKPKYFSTPNNRKHEYIAHAFENYFSGNAVFKKYMPEIYEDMIKYIDTLTSP
jgi:hypothetical protein